MELSHVSPLVVIKLGGSLLTLSDPGRRVTDLLAKWPEIRPLLVVGGGLSADAVRTWSQIHQLDEPTAHRLAIESMNVTASLARCLLPGSVVVDGRESAAVCWQQGQGPILQMERWLMTSEGAAGELPASWDVTSDSLAAWVAVRWHAEELWLLKSTALPPGVSVDKASRQGLVDRYFHLLSGKIPTLRWCHLRADQWADVIEWPDLRSTNEHDA